MRPTIRWVATLVVAVSLTTACTHAVGVSNGSVSACFRAIPVGRAAVHEKKAELIGVHRIPADQVRSHLPEAAQAQLTSENDTTVCAMSFKGGFASGQVAGAPPDQSGKYALVLVTSKRLHLLTALVLDQLPRAFGGRTL
jgi:hypothetical protein